MCICVAQFKAWEGLLAKGFIDNHADGIRQVKAANVLIIHGNTQGFIRMGTHKGFWQAFIFTSKKEIMVLAVIVINVRIHLVSKFAN